ncbi:TonB-dependent receptor plug domain-containing protein [Erythrobacter colymbi]|uniref:TonB-dependent receptor plug domain-containing protein n=1 Tax=Erythrobacter colymbi TaxID=1161202 RepID=UPI000A39E7B1|nr:TonB-dependent receptor plug domain-containing protein [Erythrobacter colymbi]
MRSVRLLPRPFCRTAPAILAAILGAIPAAAQEAPAPETPAAQQGENIAATTRSTFAPDYFARFAPRSAFDMARNVPGFAISNGDGARGLGQADTNVLINGRRISGKANGPTEALRRIPVEDVVRLELVDGASLGIGGLTGQVLNVVTSASGRVTGQFRYQPEFRSYGTPARLLQGSIALAGSGAKTEWNIALRNESNRRGNEGPEDVFDSTGTLVALRDEIANFNNDRPTLSGSFTRTAGNGNILNLNGQVQGYIYRERELSLQRPPGGSLTRTRSLRRTEDEFNYELGADYEFAAGPGRLKLIGYHRYEDSPSTSTVLTRFASGAPDQGSAFAQDADEGETILRSEYSIKAGGGNLVAALEGARNFLEIASSLSERDAAGVLRPVALDGSNARVDEDRVDAGLTWSRALATNLQLQLSVGGEYSRISQSGPLGLTRSFWRPKGFASLDWKVAANLNLAGRIERVVGQLDFFDFIASVDLDQDRADGSNVDLRPEQSWLYDIEASWRMGALGNLTVSAYLEDFIDVVDQIPLPGGGQAPGNLPSARFYGLESQATLLSDGLGWKGTRIDLTLGWNRSEVRDPLLGFVREVSENELFDVEFRLRHDLAGTPWAFGTRGDWKKNARNVRLDEISLNQPSFAQAFAFLEHKDLAGMTVRARVGNLLGQRDRFERTVFTNRAAGQVAFSERRNRHFGTVFSLDIEGSF